MRKVILSGDVKWLKKMQEKPSVTPKDNGDEDNDGKHEPMMVSDDKEEDETMEPVKPEGRNNKGPEIVTDNDNENEDDRQQDDVRAPKTPRGQWE